MSRNKTAYNFDVNPQFSRTTLNIAGSQDFKMLKPNTKNSKERSFSPLESRRSFNER